MIIGGALMKIKKITYFSILTISLTIAGTILNINATGEKVNSSQNDGQNRINIILLLMKMEMLFLRNTMKIYLKQSILTIM